MKNKLLKTLLIPTLGISALGIVTTVATSCGEQPKPSTYSVTGGSTRLFGTYGTVGSDEKTWVLKKDGEVVTKGVTWSIVDPIAGVSINDGKVSWTDTIPLGNYSLLVKATYGDETYASEDITLTISSKSEVTGGSTLLSGIQGVSGSDEKTWVFKRDGEIKTNVVWSIVEPVSGVSINDGKVSWTDTIPVGNYSFLVKATYGDETFNSEVVTLTINTEYEVKHGSTQLFGTYGNEGSDDQTWVLKKAGQEVTEGVTWSIVEPVSGVSINDGKVSWTNAMGIGTYRFKVAAAYNEQTYYSNDITLVINAAGYEITGGSLTLNGVYGFAGSDENEWKLTKDGQEVTEGVNWSIVDPIAGVSINDGKVSWLGTIQSGTYKFKVVATHEDLTVASNTITLTINGADQLVGESKTIEFVATNTGRDKGNEWHVMKDGDVVTEGVTWKLVPPAGSSVPEWIKLNENNEISWTNAVEGTYSFNIQAEYDGKTFTSSSPFVLNVGAKVFECVEVLANENSTIVLINENNSPDLSYSFNGIGWNSYTSLFPLSIPEGQTLYLRGWNPDGWSSSDDNYSRFNIAGDVSISGNVMGLLDNGTRAVRDIPCNFCFYSLFKESTGITSVSDNFLPSLNLKHDCYNDMFRDCASLTKAPQLPAMKLADACYSGMFYECTSLTQAPALPATELIDYCYAAMFEECMSLIKAPQLPAMKLASRCYSRMFADCTSLTESPYLPALNLEEGCYNCMFMNCTSLNSVMLGYAGLAYDAPTGAFDNWVDGVADKGTFYYRGPEYVHPTLFYFPIQWVMKRY